MTNKQIEFTDMTADVLTHFEQSASVWQHLTVVKDVVEGLKVLAEQAQTPVQKQLQGTSSLTVKKDELYDHMVELTMNVVRKMSGYARHKKDASLLSLVDISRSQLEKGSETEIKNRCRFILQKAKENLDKLAEYQVAQAQLDALDAAIMEYEKVPALRNATGGDIKTATANLADIIKTMRESFEILDDFTYSMIEDANFVNTYRNLRHLRSRKTVKNTGESEG